MEFKKLGLLVVLSLSMSSVLGAKEEIMDMFEGFSYFTVGSLLRTTRNPSKPDVRTVTYRDKSIRINYNKINQLTHVTIQKKITKITYSGTIKLSNDSLDTKEFEFNEYQVGLILKKIENYYLRNTLFFGTLGYGIYKYFQ